MPSRQDHSYGWLYRQRRKDFVMYYDIYIYRIAKNLWRWEVRCDSVLLRCGTATNKILAEREADEVIAVLITGGRP